MDDDTKAILKRVNRESMKRIASHGAEKRDVALTKDELQLIASALLSVSLGEIEAGEIAQEKAEKLMRELNIIYMNWECQ